MIRRQTRGTGARGTAIAGVLGALVAGCLVLVGAVERAELRTQDWRFYWRCGRQTSARVVLAEIKDSTLIAWPEPLNQWGAHYAEAINSARAFGAGWIGLDLIPEISGGENADRQLALALRRGGVVLANSRPNGRQPINPFAPLLFAHPEQGANLGFIDAPPEPDSVARHARVFIRDGKRLLPSLPAVLALSLRGQSPLDQRALRRLIPEGVQGAEAGTIWINYVGPPGRFRPVSLERLADGRLTAEQQSWLRNAVVLIGPAYAGSNDLHPGPADRSYFGVEIHANTLATLLDQRPLRRAPRFAEAAVTLALGALAAVPIAFLPFGWSLGWSAVVAGAWWLASLRAFASDALWPTAGPLLAVGLAWVGQAGGRVVQETRRRWRVQAMFGQHVSRAVVERLLNDPAAAALGGERREMTVLFSDIRDFTPMSEERQPEEIVAQLNEYLGAMAECVFRTGGTLDKYIGDAVMAFWNSPLAQEDHALRAVAAAWSMLEALRRLNERWRAAGQPALQIGIGLNTGAMLVGNLGSESRMNYTVIGHAVNLAARLESANKELDTTVLLGESTYERVRDWVEVRQHEVKVKGIDAPQVVYELRHFAGYPGEKRLGPGPAVRGKAGQSERQPAGGVGASVAEVEE